ncbi:MAG: gfo/Idh/MocA family oxidoreductase, partial [bacterium]|nr:gfo/Idh/MocA family oxidoreductase [bacterium]
MLRPSRRRFLKKAATVMAAPALIPASALGKDGRPAPSDRVTMGVAGTGWMGMGNLELFLQEPQAQVLAVCDVDRQHLDEARQMVDDKYGNSDCAATE